MGLFSGLFDDDDNRDFTRASAIYFEREPGYEKLDVVGESHYQKEIRSITGRRGNEELDYTSIGALVPEPEQSKTAVAVYVDGEKIGNLAHEDSTRYRKVTEAAEREGKLIAGEAQIRAVDPAEAATPNAGVTIWLPTPAEALAEI